MEAIYRPVVPIWEGSCQGFDTEQGPRDVDTSAGTLTVGAFSANLLQPRDYDIIAGET